MAATQKSIFDEPFYQPAAKFFPANTPVGSTFDDIKLADGLQLNIPVISSDIRSMLLSSCHFSGKTKAVNKLGNHALKS